MAQICPSCGNPASGEGRFCGQCGRELGTPITPPSVDPGPGTLTAPGTGPATADHRGIGGKRLAVLLALIALASAGSGVYVGLQGRPQAVATAGSAGRAAASSGTSPSTSTSPAGTELSELRQVAVVIQQSASARSIVNDAVNEVGGCQMKPAQAITIMNQAVAGRQDAIGRAESLPTSAIPNGQSLLGDLLQALHESSIADQDFVGWIQDMANSGSCPISTAADASYQAGYRESLRAVKAKDQFVALWNPLAQEFGQATFTASSI